MITSGLHLPEYPFFIVYIPAKVEDIKSYICTYDTLQLNYMTCPQRRMSCMYRKRALAARSTSHGCP